LGAPGLLLPPSVGHPTRFVQLSADMQELLLADPAPVMDQPPEDLQLLQAEHQVAEELLLPARFTGKNGFHHALQRIQAQIIEPLAECESLALGEVCGAIQSPSHYFTQQREERWPRHQFYSGWIHNFFGRYAASFKV
jgi:hypothetical protein